MKKYYLFLIICIFAQVVNAQQFQVESFKKVSDNASAVQEVMKDINDTPCALLRVKTNEANVKITGNVIGNVMTNGNEYLVNVASGTKKVTVAKKGLYPVTVICSEYGFNHMQSNALYELTLKRTNVSKEVSGEIYGHEYVDLGLSVKWATCNVGAKNIEEKGASFRYGETDEYDEERPYIFGQERPDNLQPSNDVAHVKWGHSWRMPTYAEYEELDEKCKKVWTFRNEVPGLMYIGSNGNTLFFPSTEDHAVIEYWLFNGEIIDAKDDRSIIQRMMYPQEGYVVRPVSTEPREKESWQEDYSMKADGFNNAHHYVDLGLSVKWATMNVGSRYDYEIGEKYAWGETTQKSEDASAPFKWGCSYEFDHTEFDHTDNNFIDIYHYVYRESLDKRYGPSGQRTLDKSDDAASVKWGGNWRTPSVNEIKELISKCEWTWTYNYKNKGVSGYVIISKVKGYTDKSIFIPVNAISKDSFYMSNERQKWWYEYLSEWETGNCFVFAVNQFQVDMNEDTHRSRLEGFFVRPVFK